jgi:hypothetical protein
MNRICICWAAVVMAAGLLFVPTARAQAPGMPGNIGFNAAVARLFGDIPAFSATVETVLTNRSERSRLTVPMRMLKLQDRFRIEVDFVKMKGSGVAFTGLGAMQNIGMARMVSLVLPEEKGMIVMFPDIRFYARVPLSEADLPSGGFKLNKRQAGRETVNGQACIRQQVTITGTGGEKTEATTWEAPALSHFPVRMLFRPGGDSMMMNFSEVRLAAPAADQFKVPADYKAFNSIGGLMQEAMTQAYQPQGAR